MKFLLDRDISKYKYLWECYNILFLVLDKKQGKYVLNVIRNKRKNINVNN
jgi:hypothetical protein